MKSKEYENLYDFAQRMAKLKRPPEEWVEILKHNTKNHICNFCGKKLVLFTTKTGNQYESNPDKSPHRKNYKCVSSWEEYNGNN